MFKVCKWLIGVTSSVLFPLVWSTLCRIFDQFLGILLYVVAVWAVCVGFVYSRGGVGVFGFSFWGFVALVVGVVVCVSVLKAFLRYGEQFFGHFVAFKSLELLRKELFSKLWPQAPAVMFRSNSGDLLALATKDIDRIEVFFAHTFAPGVSAIVVCFTVLCLLFLCGGKFVCGVSSLII